MIYALRILTCIHLCACVCVDWLLLAVSLHFFAPLDLMITLVKTESTADLSSNECITILRPADGKVITPSEDLHLHENSTIVGALDVDSSGNWLVRQAVLGVLLPSLKWIKVCGGGERYQSLWNLPAMSITRFLPTAGDGQQCCFTQSEVC